MYVWWACRHGGQLVEGRLCGAGRKDEDRSHHHGRQRPPEDLQPWRPRCNREVQPGPQLPPAPAKTDVLLSTTCLSDPLLPSTPLPFQPDLHDGYHSGRGHRLGRDTVLWQVVAADKDGGHAAQAGGLPGHPLQRGGGRRAVAGGRVGVGSRGAEEPGSAAWSPKRLWQPSAPRNRGVSGPLPEVGCW